jgi:hypothetical protein
MLPQLTEALRRKAEGRGFDPPMVSLEFLIKFCPHYGPGFDSVSNGNKYQEYFMGGKSVGAYS